jgi:DNA repair exonuclease SbcCD ATPase subunit
MRHIPLTIIACCTFYSLPDWQKKREDYLVDLEQFQDLNKKMDEHKKSLQQKKEDLVKELADTNEKLARMNVHIQDLKQTVESQDLAPNEVIKLENESKGAIEAMDRLQKVKEKREKELAENDAILEKHVVVCETVMDQLNSKLGDVRSFAEFSDSFKQYKFMLKKDKLLESDPIETFGVNCKESLEPAIASAIQETETKASTAKLNSQEALDRLDESESNKQEALSMKQIVLDKIAKSEESLQHEQDAHATKLAVREREIDAMERKVEARRDPMVLEEQMAVMERQLAELEALREKHEAENIHKKAMVMEEIESACDLMMEQEDFLRQKVKEVEQYRTQKLAVAPSINVPSGFSLDK